MLVGRTDITVSNAGIAAAMGEAAAITRRHFSAALPPRVQD